MAITGESSLEALLARVERDDPVQARLESAREQLQQARRKLGLPESGAATDDGRRRAG